MKTKLSNDTVSQSKQKSEMPITKSNAAPQNSQVTFLLRGIPGGGHIIPGCELAKDLKPHCYSISFITYGLGPELLKRRGFKKIVELPYVKSQKNCFPWKNLQEVTTEVIPILKQADPKIVIIDGETDAAFLLKGLNYKVVLIAPTVYINRDIDPYKRYEEYGNSVCSVADKVIVHGLTQPHKSFKNMVFVGPLTEDFGSNTSNKGLVPIFISTSTSQIFNKSAKDFEKILNNAGYRTLLIGPSKLAYFPKNVGHYFKNSPFIVTHGGLSTLEQAYVMGKHALILHSGDVEKDKNAIEAEKLGFGKYINLNALNEKEIRNQLDVFLNTCNLQYKALKNGVHFASRIILEMLNVN